MADTIDEAAAAFQTDIKGGVAEKAPAKIEKISKPTERMFSHLGEKAEEDTTPAGGDDLPNEGEVKEDEEQSEEPPEQEEEQKEEDEGDEKEEEEGEEDATDVFEVVVDGEKAEVSLKEALEGYVRTETFHRRLSQLMEAQQVVAKNSADVQELRAKYAGMLEELQEQMEAMVPKEPDWDEMFKKDPVGARALQKQYDDFYKQHEAVKTKREQTLKDNAEANSKQLETYINTEAQKFHGYEKKWADPKQFQKDLNAMRATAMSHGFSENEIDTVYDSRMLQVLYKASKYDRLMANKPQPVKRGKSVQPGPGNTRTGQRGMVQAQKRLAQSGSIDDAATVFHNILRR